MLYKEGVTQMKRILLFASIVLILVGIRAGLRAEDTPLGNDALSAVLGDMAPDPIEDIPDNVIAVTGEENIRQLIQNHIIEFEIGPQEPRHDIVWQFVPGLHGVEFDFELSYQNMLMHGQFDQSLMVRRSIPYEGSNEEFRRHRIYRGNENSPYVGLLINVAWGGDELTKMLDILDEHNVQASIFFEGRYANNNRDLVLDVFNRGHIIGNHSYSHPANWLDLSYDNFEEEIVLTNEIIADITGEETTFFAPPAGAFTDDTIQAAYDQGMYTVLWSADSIDWRGEPASVLVERVMDRITPGGLILTHPKPETVIALPEIIEQVRGEGYEFRRIDEIVSGERERLQTKQQKQPVEN